MEPAAPAAAQSEKVAAAKLGFDAIPAGHADAGRAAQEALHGRKVSADATPPESDVKARLQLLIESAQRNHAAEVATRQKAEAARKNTIDERRQAIQSVVASSHAPLLLQLEAAKRGLDPSDEALGIMLFTVGGTTVYLAQSDLARRTGVPLYLSGHTHYVKLTDHDIMEITPERVAEAIAAKVTEALASKDESRTAL